MKTSNKIIVIAFLWFVSLLAYDKHLKRKQYDNIFHKIFKVKPITKKEIASFKHISITGGNKRHVYIENKEKSNIYSKYGRSRGFNYHVKNDTLYLKILEKRKKFLSGFDNDSPLIINFKELESVTVDKSNVWYTIKNKDHITIKLKENSKFNADVKNMKNMDIEIGKGSQFRFYSSNRNKKKSVVDSISINLKEYSTLNLNNANFKSLNKINVSKNTKIVYPIKYKEQ